MGDAKKRVAAARARKLVQREKSKNITGRELKVAQGNIGDDLAAMGDFFMNPLKYADSRNDGKKLYRKN
jgi:F420-0:gamma-glutamyl ligase